MRHPRVPDFDLLQDLARRIGARQARDIAAGMGAGPAKPEAGDRHAVLLIAGRGAQEEHLVQGHLAMMPLAAGQAVLRLQILGRQGFGGDDAAGADRARLARADRGCAPGSGCALRSFVVSRRR